jgi:hypothetical protein
MIRSDNSSPPKRLRGVYWECFTYYILEDCQLHFVYFAHFISSCHTVIYARLTLFDLIILIMLG